ncbi:MAG: hypothetical protein KJN68_01585, partial [Bacteroidia bacterium]|nr:hypothetical protein [Bacteroidia bacterium]
THLMRIIKFTILFLAPILFFNCQSKESNPQKEMNTALLLNHTGYHVDGLKKIVLQTSCEDKPGNFEIIDADKQVVFKGSFSDGGQIDNWHTGNA